MAIPEAAEIRKTLIEAVEIGLIATLAAAAGALFTRQFHHESALLGGIWAAVSGVVVYGDRAQIIGNSRRRMIGTVLGGIVSALFLLMFDPTLVLLGACAALTAALVILLGLSGHARLAVVTTVVIFAVQHEHRALSPFFNAGLRMAESAIGMSVCLLIVLVSPLGTRHSVSGEADDDAM